MKGRAFFSFVLTLAAVILIACTAEAQSDFLRYKIYEQQEKIDQAVRSGQLPPEQAGTLRGNTNYIWENFENYGGNPPKTEEQRLNQMLDDNSYMLQNTPGTAQKLY